LRGPEVRQIGAGFGGVQRPADVGAGLPVPPEDQPHELIFPHEAGAIGVDDVEEVATSPRCGMHPPRDALWTI